MIVNQTCGNMWWNIIKQRLPEEIHIQDIITEELEAKSNAIGIPNLDIRFKDRLVSAGVPISNDGMIPLKAWFDWVEEDDKYFKRTTLDFQLDMKRSVRMYKNVMMEDGIRYSYEAIVDSVKEGLLVVVEIEDNSAASKLEHRELFGNQGVGSIPYYRGVQMPDEQAQRHVPEDEET